MFDVTTPEDFYAMLVEDFDEFMADPHSTRRALHCAVLAYHLHEWIWGGWLKRDDELRDKLNIRDFNGFVQWIDNHCVWFRFVQEIVNGTKHFRPAQGFETVRVVAAPFALDQPTAGFDEGAWNGPIRYIAGEFPIGFDGKGYLVLDLGSPVPHDNSEAADLPMATTEESDIEPVPESRYLPAAYLLEVIVRFWRDFFRLHRPSANVRSSKFHVSNGDYT
jgi:hypothetical protein